MILEITRKKSIAAILVLVALIAIPITVYLSGQSQDTRSRASGPVNTGAEEVIVATINGEGISKAQVRTIAQEQFAPEDVYSEALKNALLALEERRILDKAAVTFGITLDSEKVNDLVQNGGLSDTEAKYEVLRDQVALKAVNSVEALSIEFWNPPANSLSSLSSQEKTNAAKQLEDGNLALAEAQTSLESGEDILTIAEALIVKYPSLSPVLSINGQIVSTLEAADKSLAKKPAMYEFGNSGLDQATQDQLFAMQASEIKKITGTESNAGGSVFKITTKGISNGSSTYDAWYTEQKASQVSEVGNL